MSTYAHGIEVGDKVRILIGEGDSSYYGMVEEMRGVRGEVGTVQEVEGDRILVSHPEFLIGYSYKSSEVMRVRGDKGNIIKNPALSEDVHRNAPSDATHYNVVCPKKYLKRDEAGTIYFTGDKTDRWKAYLYPELVGQDHLDAATPLMVEKTIRGKSADSVIVDDPAAERIQSPDELVAENESLEKQIRKLEARVERKKEFQRQNVRKIAAWQVILGE